jgi:hypothetical protein
LRCNSAPISLWVGPTRVLIPNSTGPVMITNVCP